MGSSLTASRGLVPHAALGFQATRPSIPGLHKQLLRLVRSPMCSSSTVFPGVQSLGQRRVPRTGHSLFSSRQVLEIPDFSKRLSVAPTYLNTPTNAFIAFPVFV